MLEQTAVADVAHPLSGAGADTELETGWRPIEHDGLFGGTAADIMCVGVLEFRV